ncbi:hypothetical protein KEM56_003523, partial [Ascosphaera pollenicola]
MAFQAPAHLQRTPYAPGIQRSRSVRGSQAADRHRHPSDNDNVNDDETDEWVLFSPTDKTDHSLSIIDRASNIQRQPSETSTIRTPLTHTLTRISDLDSWNDYEPLPGTAQLHQEDADADEGEQEDEEIESTEFDSLDDGLHAFNEPLVLRPSLLASDSAQDPLQQSSVPILPAHDGLGSFVPSALRNTQDAQLQQETASEAAAESQSQSTGPDDYISPVDHVEYNDFSVAPPPAYDDPQRDRWQRIEDWRMEQGRALLAELEKEIRRQRKLESKQMLTTVSSGQPHAPDCGKKVGSSGPHESSWYCATRRFIHDIIGIDEDVLAVLFGDSFSSYGAGSDSDTCNSSQKELLQDFGNDSSDSSDLDDPGSLQRSNVHERIAKELGILVQHLYEESPFTFSTYTKYSSDSPRVPYDGHKSQTASRQTETRKDSTAPADVHSMSTTSPNLLSTLNGKERSQQSHQTLNRNDEAAARDDEEHGFWEQNLSVTMIFQFLISRFSGSSPGSTEHPSRPKPAECSRYQAQRRPHGRAEVIRKVHPLVPQSPTAQTRTTYPT